MRLCFYSQYTTEEERMPFHYKWLSNQVKKELYITLVCLP